MKRRLQGTAKTSHKVVGLRMEAHGPGTRNVQEGTQYIPDRGCELGSIVICNLGRNSKAQDQAIDESPGTIPSKDGGQRNSLWLRGRPVQDGEEISISSETG